MSGVRFYLEFPSRSARCKSGRAHTGHNGNVFAAFVCNGRTRDGGYEGLGGVYPRPNSPVAGTACSAAFLRQCKRIPEALAKRIHPALFDRLEAN